MATLLQILNADRDLSKFSRGLRLAGLEEKLGGSGFFTMLVPINRAISELFRLSYEQLLEPVHLHRLIDFLSGYILPGKLMYTELQDDQQLAALNGERVAVAVRNEQTFINGAKIIVCNRQGCNGVIHLLDKTYPF